MTQANRTGSASAEDSSGMDSGSPTHQSELGSVGQPVEQTDNAAFRSPGKARLFYGYWMIPVATLAQICSAPGQTFAVSAFIPSLRESLDLSEAWLTSAYMIGTFCAAFPLLLVGPAADRFGNRRVLSAVSLALVATCLLASRIDTFWTLLLSFGLLRFLGQGAMSLLSNNTASMWFQSQLGRVSAVMNVGMAIAFAMIPGWILSSIDAIGWRQTFVVIAAVIAAIMLPALLLIYRNRPEDVGQLPDGRRPRHMADATAEPSSQIVEPTVTLAQAARHRSFWIVLVAMTAWALIGTGLVFYLLEIGATVGISHVESAAVFRLFAFSMLAVQLVGGWAADRYPINRLLALSMALLTGGVASLLMLQSLTQMRLFALLFGAGQGMAIVVGATVWVRYYGRAHLGAIRGAAWSASVAGSGVGPFVLGVAQDSLDSFRPAMLCFVSILLPLTLVSLWATPPTHLFPIDAEPKPS